MGLPIFFEPDPNTMRNSESSDCHCCSHNSCSGWRGKQYCGHLAAVTWARRWYDPWASLHAAISHCLGHSRFSYWGGWTPLGHGRSGVYKLIVRSDYPWTRISPRDITSLTRPDPTSTVFCLERCSAQAMPCCARELRMLLYEIELAMLQPGSIPVGNECLHTFLQSEFLAPGVL